MSALRSHRAQSAPTSNGWCNGGERDAGLRSINPAAYHGSGFSEDLPVIVEIVDSEERIAKFVPLLAGFEEIGLVTCDEVRVLLYSPIPCEK